MDKFKYDKNIFLKIKRFLIRERTSYFFYILVFSKIIRYFFFKRYLKQYNKNIGEYSKHKKNLVVIWEDRFKFLKSKIIEDQKINLVIIPRIFFSPGWHVLLKSYHNARSIRPLGEYCLDFYRSDQFKKDRFKFRKYCHEVMKFINQFINVDMVLMPKCNDDWTIDYIKVINDLNFKLFIDDREGAITAQRMLKVPQKLRNIDLRFNLMTTQNSFHKSFFVKAGFPEDKIIVNGATQTDYWFKKESWLKLSEIEPKLRNDLIKILFFSFGERTYMNFYYGNEKRTWMPLIKDVNDVLIEILNKYEGKVQILYKTSLKFERDISSDVYRFIQNTKEHIEKGYLLFLDGSKSSFDLIRHSQLIVGFQTTGMIEAMNTEKKIIYCAWGDLYSDIKDSLLPLEDEKCLTVCSNKDLFYFSLSEFIEKFGRTSKKDDLRIFRNNFIEKYFAKSNGLVCTRLANMIYEKI